jgi:hypothetical protein
MPTPRESALQTIGLSKPTWQTLIVAAAQEIDLPAAGLWETWSRLGDWPLWSTPLHLAAHWAGAPGWATGASFTQTINLGFPIGQLISTETVVAYIPGRQVSWARDQKGIRSCHIWDFEPLAVDRTRVTNLEVFHGLPIGLLKPLVAGRWQQLFAQSVAGLARQAAPRS